MGLGVITPADVDLRGFSRLFLLVFFFFLASNFRSLCSFLTARVAFRSFSLPCWRALITFWNLCFWTLSIPPLIQESLHHRVPEAHLFPMCPLWRSHRKEISSHYQLSPKSSLLRRSSPRWYGQYFGLPVWPTSSRRSISGTWGRLAPRAPQPTP